VRLIVTDFSPVTNKVVTNFSLVATGFCWTASEVATDFSPVTNEV
jgi:hypothetical protein